ncbi:MAG: hypothetical protein NZ899_09080 [Thermoguttaceae bacterium]|nr:hypothetical protein [Thermoguttaceae bacterium]MDW8079883.1 hypothetical protein [Thermoguttaceae bacterium]
MDELRLPAWALFPAIAGRSAACLSRASLWACCRDALWLASLRRSLPQQVNILPAESIADLLGVLRSSGPLFFVYQWQAESLEEFTRLASSVAGRPWPTGFAVVGRGFSPGQLMTLRAFGAWEVVSSPRNMAVLARVIVRFFQKAPWWSWPERSLSPVHLPWQERL